MAKILVIEDQKLLCQLYGSILTKAKHNVVLAYTGEEGIEAALRDRPDLVILDLKLPGIPGAEVARQLRDQGVLDEASLIIATALGDDAYPVVQSFNAAVLLPKPFQVSTMIAAVKEALNNNPEEPELAALA